MQITIDTREQQAWSFPEYIKTKREALGAGDYALLGDRSFAVERKSLDDFVGTISSGWPVFQKELMRMRDAEFPARVIIVEADWSEVINHDYNHPEVLPHFVLKRVAELTLMRVSVLFCSNPTSAAGLCWKMLETYKGLIEDE